jgi:hypothetical protein
MRPNEQPKNRGGAKNKPILIRRYLMTHIYSKRPYETK